MPLKEIYLYIYIYVYIVFSGMLLLISCESTERVMIILMKQFLEMVIYALLIVFFLEYERVS